MMQLTVKYYADFLILGLETGICNTCDVVAWGDQLVEKHEKPDYWMIDLSTCAGKHRHDIRQLLSDVPGVNDWDISFRLLMAKLPTHYPTMKPEGISQSEAICLLRRLYALVHRPISDDFKALMGEINQVLEYWTDDDGRVSEGEWEGIEESYQCLLLVGEIYRSEVLN
jgi:hypothetical protein